MSHYDRELTFFKQIMEQLHVQTLQLTPDGFSRIFPDCGIRAALGHYTTYATTASVLSQYNRPATIYRFTDRFDCHYLYFRFPEPSSESLLVGPFLHTATSRETLMEMVREYQLTAEQYHRFESIYSGIPVLTDTIQLSALLNTLGSSIFKGADAFEFIDLNIAEEPVLPTGSAQDDDMQQLLKMQMLAMEARYAQENELIELVRRGRGQKAAAMVSNFSTLIIEDRAAGPLRNHQNYCIILNTLLRKAAEQGGVHPVYIDRLSSGLSRQIEQMSKVADVAAMMQQLIEEYSRLVSQYANRYCPTIQRLVAYIDYDLSADLSLRTCAKMLNLSIGYLSVLFRRETGQTLTAFIHQRRMEYGSYLLSSTDHSISTIAHLCGIADDNYFGKLFKRYTGKTPRQFREERRLLRREPSKS